MTAERVSQAATMGKPRRDLERLKAISYGLRSSRCDRLAEQQYTAGLSVHDLIHTKVAPPTWVGAQIRRDRLLARLDDALTRRLTIIHAPAGYGKTSLLAQWRGRFDSAAVLVAWLTLERDDADLTRLAQYIALAIDGAEQADLAEDGSAEGGERMSSDLPSRAALSAIINRLAREPRPVVLILDDLHRAESQAVTEFLTALIRLAPANCHFVIASRDYPWLGQSILAAAEQVVELVAEDLKFSVREAEAMLSRASGAALDGGDVQGIVQRTEGWPIALQLASLSLKRGADHKQLVSRFSGPSSELARYLSEQVLTTLPDDMREIVIRTALLDRLTGEAVNLLCDREDGWLMLERLEQQGLFLTPLSPDRKVYRYHQLFADYLREHLVRRDGAQFRSLQRRAARWFAGRGEVAEAVDHAILADDDGILTDIIEEAGGWRLIPQGLQPVLERGLAKLREAIVIGRPRLLLARVYLSIKRGEMAKARIDYDRFLVAAAGVNLPADLWTEIRVVGDTLADYENVPVSLDDLLDRETLLRTLPADDHLVLANFTETLGAKYLEGGWLERALEPTLAARDHYQALGSLYSDLFTRFLESRIKLAQGRLKDAIGILAAARVEIETGFGDRSDLAANCAAFEAELLYEQNRCAEASGLLDWALAHMEQSDGWVDVYAAAYFTAARAAAAEGAMDDAHATIARARRVADRRRLRQLELLADLCQLDLLIQYDHGTAQARAHAAGMGLDGLADDMAQESPLYRPVATAAALCRVKLALRDGDHANAIAELRSLKRWASRHGAGRLLIDVNILLAFGLRCSAEPALGQACFDEAVGIAMFQGILRPFIDAGRFVEPFLVGGFESAAQSDRFRGRFLKTLSRALVSRSAPSEPDVLNDAEATILRHLGQGISNKEIARLIGMSPDTVKYRLKSIFRKIDVNTRRDAVRVSRERGLAGLGQSPSTL